MEGSITVDANSDIRNQCDLTMVVTDSTFDVNEDAKIWFDKYIRVLVGLKNLRMSAPRWYNRGLFIHNTTGYQFDASTSTLSLSMTDLMGKTTGIRGGQISGSGTVVTAGNGIRNVMISTITQLAGFDKYIIEDVGEKVPYDLKFATGAYVYDIVSTLRDLYPGWETFFDEDGTFICQPIPTLESDAVVMDDSLLRPLVTSEQININFSDVKNIIELWGADTDSEGQTTATIADTNPESPFCVDEIGEIREVLSGSPYDKIYTNDLCRQRAEYELWCKTRLNDNLTLETVPIYWLDVNQKFIYTSVKDNMATTREQDKKQYIIKKLTIPLGLGTMTIEAIRFYPLYPNIVT